MHAVMDVNRPDAKLVFRGQSGSQQQQGSGVGATAESDLPASRLVVVVQVSIDSPSKAVYQTRWVVTL